MMLMILRILGSAFLISGGCFGILFMLGVMFAGLSEIWGFGG